MEQGESCLYVKVNCRDRRGLLGDIIMALKAMPLEVTNQLSSCVLSTADGLSTSIRPGCEGSQHHVTAEGHCTEKFQLSAKAE